MKKLIVAVIAAGIMVAGGCCKKGGCSASNDPKCDRCNTEYCKYIGTRLHDERVLKGETVTFKDGEGKDEVTIIRPVPKSSITKWKSFEEMNPGMVAKPMEVVDEPAAKKMAPAKKAPAKKEQKVTKPAPKKEKPAKKAEKKDDMKK